VARRNIFDRDTRAGDYSDTLGNFLENIPSIYGQLAKEKRLERLDREDRNFRTTQYNNQLLQQQFNNRRLAESDILNRKKFEADKKNVEFDNAMEIANAFYDKTGDPSRVIQVQKKFFPNIFSKKDADKLTNNFSSGKQFSDDLGDWEKLNFNNKFSRGNELQDLISKSTNLMKIGSPQEKTFYRSINKELREEYRDLASKSGKPISDTSLWNDQAKLDFFNDYGQQIKSKEKQISDKQGDINDLVDIPGNKSLNARNKKMREQHKEIIQKLEKEKTLIVLQRQKIQDGFKYPIFEFNTAGEFEGMKASRPNIEEESPSNFLSERYGIEEEEANEALQQVDAELLASVDNMDGENIDGFLDVLNSNDPKALQNYLSSNQELEGGINTEYKKPVIGTDSTDDPNTLPLPNLTAGSENRFAENIAKEDAMPKPDLGKSEEEISKEALQYDVPSIPEDRQTANYITKDLSKDLSRLNSLKEMQSKIENIEQKSSTITRDYNKRKITISKLENNIKSKIGDFINPVSGDISISDKGYKDAVISRLEKKFGKDLYSILASLSNIQK